MKVRSLIVTIILFAIGSMATKSWYSEHIDGASLVSNKICVDAQGSPCCVCWDADTQSLVYFYQANGQWMSEIINRVSWSSLKNPICVGPDGIPHVAYMDVYTDALIHAWRSDGKWITEVVDNYFRTMEISSIECDAQGRIHIGYNKGRYLKYAVKDQTGWTRETVDNEDHSHFAMAVDGTGSPHYIYRPTSWMGTAYHIYRSNGDWVKDPLGAEFNDMTSASLCFANNTLHVSFAVEDVLYYACLDNNVWDVEMVDTEFDYNTSIAVNPDGEPGICYVKSVAGGIGRQAFAEKSQGTWNVTLVKDDGAQEHAPSLTYDLSGNTHIMIQSDHHERHTSEMRHIYREKGGSFFTEMLPGWGCAGESPSLAIGADQNLHMSYYDIINATLKYAMRNEYGWHIETVDAGGKTGWGSSIQIDENNNPHVTYLDIESNRLKYATCNEGGWSFVDVDAAWGESRTSLALDSKGKPHVCYFDHITETLKYAYLNESGWHAESAVSQLIGGTAPVSALALDSNDCPRIVLFDTSSGYVRYAWKTPELWTVETVGEAFGDRSSLAIALDHQNDPHIVYIHENDLLLMYAHKPDGVWNHETICDNLQPLRNVSMFVDSDDSLHVCFREGFSSGSTYGVLSDGEWTMKPVTGHFYRDFPIVIDDHKNPHICYFDGSALFHATSNDINVKLQMPSSFFLPGDICECTLEVNYRMKEVNFEGRVFVILDVAGSYYFAPAFTDFDSYTFIIGNSTANREDQKIVVIPPFNWPNGAGSAAGIRWYAALTDNAVTTIISNLDTWTFGWGD